MGVWLLLQVKSTACTRLHSLESLGFQQLFSPANGHHETLFQVGTDSRLSEADQTIMYVLALTPD